ncbi:MAG: nitrate reductase associated protein [Thiomonas sp.]
MPARATHTVWESRQLPERVRQSALDKGLILNGPQSWADLSALQRYTLFKLTRSGHENRNFRLALEEFGLRKPPC